MQLFTYSPSRLPTLTRAPTHPHTQISTPQPHALHVILLLRSSTKAIKTHNPHTTLYLLVLKVVLHHSAFEIGLASSTPYHLLRSITSLYLFNVVVYTPIRIYIYLHPPFVSYSSLDYLVSVGSRHKVNTGLCSFSSQRLVSDNEEGIHGA